MRSLREILEYRDELGRIEREFLRIRAKFKTVREEVSTPSIHATTHSQLCEAITGPLQRASYKRNANGLTYISSMQIERDTADAVSANANAQRELSEQVHVMTIIALINTSVSGTASPDELEASLIATPSAGECCNWLHR
jgi:hypothetical protein